MTDEIKKAEQNIANDEAQNTEQTEAQTEVQVETQEEQIEEQTKPAEKVEYDAELNILTLRPGASAKEVEALEIADGCKIFFDNNNTSQVETFELSGDLLKTIGSKARHVEIGENLSFEYISPQGGDIWGNLSELRSLRIRNNIGVPTNIDGTGAFQNHPTLRNVEMQLSAEGQLSDNFCRATALSGFMVHSVKPGKEYGLKAGDNVLFGSALETEKGISTADWNKIHGKQIRKPHDDYAYLSELGRFEGTIESALRALDQNKPEEVRYRPYLLPIFKEAASQTYSKSEIEELATRELGQQDFARLMPKAKKILNDLKTELTEDLLGAYLNKAYCHSLVENVLQGCSDQARNGFKDACAEVEFRQESYKAEIERDEDFRSTLDDTLKIHLEELKNLTQFGVKESGENLISNALKAKSKEKALSLVMDPRTDEKTYTQALMDVSDAINATAFDNKEQAKRCVRNISDTFGLRQSTGKRIQTLTALGNTYKKQEGTYIELPSRLWTGDNFLSCRKTEIHSSTDPDKRAYKSEVEAFTKKTVNAIYLSCVEYRESLWKVGLKSVMDDLGGRVGIRTYDSLVKEKDPIEAYNRWAPLGAKATKESLITRGIEQSLKGLSDGERSQVQAVFSFALNTAENLPKDFWKAVEEYDQQISSIVQNGDKGFEELRRILPSLDLSVDGHVLDFEEAKALRDTKDIFVVGEGSKFGDNCFCYVNCNGIYAGHNENEYRHFKNQAESEYLSSKQEIEPMIETRLGIVPGSDNDKDADEAGALRDDIKSNIVNLEKELAKAPSEKEKGTGKKTKAEYLEEIKEWKAFQEKYEDYTAKRQVWEANDTEEKWLSHNSYALRDVNERIRKFEEVNATTKTKDFKTHSDIYTMNREALTDEKRAEYDKLIAERNAILVSPQKVVTGSHFLSEGKEMENLKTIIAGEEINAGHDSFSNNPEVMELHKNNPETNITKDVMKKNLYHKSDIFRGRLLMAKEALKDIFDSRNFRYMRLEEACLDIIVNLFKILFNLTTWATNTIEREIRQGKTRRGIYNRNVDEAKEILLTCSGKDGAAFLERLTSKTSPISEYNAVLRVVGRLNLNKILSSNGSDGKKLEQIHSQAQKRLINAVNAKERADGLNKRDGLSKAQLLGIYRQIGLWTREKGTIKTSRSLGRAVAMLGRR